MRKISKIVAPVALIMAFMLFSPHEAKAWRLFGRQQIFEISMIESDTGCLGILHVYERYVFGIYAGTVEVFEPVKCPG
jgi:hypothetical protein